MLSRLSRRLGGLAESSVFWRSPLQVKQGFHVRRAGRPEAFTGFIADLRLPRMIVSGHEMHPHFLDRPAFSVSGHGWMSFPQDRADFSKHGGGILANLPIREPMNAERQVGIGRTIDPGLQPRYEIRKAFALDAKPQR